jgi:hypothetical protein
VSQDRCEPGGPVRFSIAPKVAARRRISPISHDHWTIWPDLRETRGSLLTRSLPADENWTENHGRSGGSRGLAPAGLIAWTSAS